MVSAASRHARAGLGYFPVIGIRVSKKYYICSHLNRNWFNIVGSHRGLEVGLRSQPTRYVDPMLGHRRRQWSNIEPAFIQRLV